MKTVLLSLLYFLDTTIQTILFKILISSYHVDDYIYTCFIKSIIFLFVFYMLYKNYRDPTWYDILNGFLDYFEAVLSLLSFIGLSWRNIYNVQNKLYIFWCAIHLCLQWKKIGITQIHWNIINIYCKYITPNNSKWYKYSIQYDLYC